MNTQEPQPTPPLRFKTNILLKNLVGKDLINDDNIAVVELIKNSYDADSPSVLVKFEGFTSHERTTAGAKLLISDRGSGMDRKDIEDKWLNIAYSDKAGESREHGGHYAGNKGIGRFSCDRLGARLDLITRKQNGELLHLEIPWADFEKEGQKDLTIQSVDIELNAISQAEADKLAGIDVPKRGTTLVISKLRSVWDREKLLGLRRSLEKFLSPNEAFTKDGFRIELDADGLKSGDKSEVPEDRVTGKIENHVFSKLQFRSTYVESSIDDAGKTIETAVWHEGKCVFRLTEQNDIELANVSTVVYYLNPYKKAYFKRQTGFRSIDFGSVFLFLNGFRVAPYGDRGDDWLGLDVRKTQGLTRYLSSREVVGRVEVFTKDEEAFKPVSSREGLKNTAAFQRLKEDFILEAIKRLEKFVVDGLDWDSIPDHLRTQLREEQGLDWKKSTEEYVESWDKKRQRIALSIMSFIGSSQDKIIKFWFDPSLLEAVQTQRSEEVEKVLRELDDYDSHQIDSGLRQNLGRLRKLVEKHRQEAVAAKSDASRLRTTVEQQKQKIGKLAKESEVFRAQSLFLQSTSTLDAKQLTAFHHEILQNGSVVDNYMPRLMTMIRTGEPKEKVLSVLEKVGQANRRIIAIAQFATKANFKLSTNKELTDIPTFVEQYVNNVARQFIASSINRLDVTNSVRETFEIPVRRIELSIVIDNVMRNAVKAQARSVTVKISKKAANVVQISFLDDGKGLSDELKNIDDIFEYGITTTSGSGLGLYHAREFIKSLGGTITAHRGSPKGFEIRLELMR